MILEPEHGLSRVYPNGKRRCYEYGDQFHWSGRLWTILNMSTCPRTFAGKRCKRWSWYRNQKQMCICQLAFYCVMDHNFRVRSKDGQDALMSFPYQAYDSTHNAYGISDFIAEVHELGLDVMIAGNSPYNCGTAVIKLTRKGL